MLCCRILFGRVNVNDNIALVSIMLDVKKSIKINREILKVIE